ncbi:MAG: efflux RND transporter permease subunit, partial [Planctomycetota bacterium]
MNPGSFYFRNPRLMLLTVSLILVAGLSSFSLLPRMEDPALVSRGAFVNTVFPGAEPSQIESLISEKIEDALTEIDEIKEIRSTSRESVSTIAIELRDNVIASESVWSKIRDRISDVESELPPGSFRPDFDEMDFKAYALLAAICWDQDDEVSFSILNRWAKQLEDTLQGVSGTEKAELKGQPSEEIRIIIDPDQLIALNLTVADISRQIANSDSKLSAGQIRGNSDDLLIEVDGELDSIQRIENIPIAYSEDGGFVRLSNLARVERSVVDPPDSLAIVDGKTAIVVGAFVRPNQRVDVWSRGINEVLDEFESQLPRGLKLDRMFVQNDYVEDRLSTLLKNLFFGACAVFMVIFVLMGWRSAIVVSLALPLSSMIVLFVMRLMDVPVHQMSITGLIIALGLLIDNAIVIVDEVSVRLSKGKSKLESVTDSVKHLLWPLFGSTLTTALAFAPIALMAGPAGEFVGAIAITVIAAIFGSLFLAMTIIPTVAAKLTPVGSKDDSSTQKSNLTFLRHGYSNPALTRFYKRILWFFFRYPAAGVTFGVIAPILGFIAATELPEQFFPPADRDQIHIELELSPLSSVAGTLDTTERIREMLLKEAEVERVDWFIGESAPAFYYNLIPRRVGISQYAQALVKLKTFQNQSDLIHRLQQKLDREFAHARVLVRQLEQGPPFDAPVEVRLFGPDLKTLRELGGEIRSLLVKTPGVIHTRSEMDEALPKVSFEVNEEQARRAGLSLTDIASQMNATTEGAIGGSILEATEELPVRVRVANSQRADLDQISQMNILQRNQMTNQDYGAVPLSAIADLNLVPEYGSITHLAGMRLNEIQVYIPAGVLPSSVLSRFQTRLEKSDFQLPEGYFLTYGGEAAKRDEAVANLMANVGILVVLMIATLVLSFASFRIAGIVGMVGVLSIGLGMGALWIFGYPFGFTAIIG